MVWPRPDISSCFRYRARETDTTQRVSMVLIRRRMGFGLTEYNPAGKSRIAIACEVTDRLSPTFPFASPNSKPRSSAHWALVLQRFGHTVPRTAPQFDRAYRDAQGNHVNDACGSTRSAGHRCAPKMCLISKTECSRKVGMRFIECGAAGWSPNTDQEPDSWFAC
jgi:hypothetical protein